MEEAVTGKEGSDSKCVRGEEMVKKSRLGLGATHEKKAWCKKQGKKGEEKKKNQTVREQKKRMKGTRAKLVEMSENFEKKKCRCIL